MKVRIRFAEENDDKIVVTELMGYLVVQWLMEVLASCGQQFMHGSAALNKTNSPLKVRLRNVENTAKPKVTPSSLSSPRKGAPSRVVVPSLNKLLKRQREANLMLSSVGTLLGSAEDGQKQHALNRNSLLTISELNLLVNQLWKGRREC